MVTLWNRFSKAKLPGSKWTARYPKQQEKHFLVLGWVQYRLNERLERVEIEAIQTRRIYEIDYRELKDASRWQMGWH